MTRLALAGSRCALYAIGVSVLAGPPAAARPLTQLPSELQTVRTAATEIASIAVEDFDGDGLKDIAYTQAGSTFLSLLFGKADGTYTAPATTNLGDSNALLAIGDFNRDGRADLAVARRGLGAVSIWTNAGNGSFSLTSEVAVGGYAKSIIATDLEHDGQLEIVAVNVSLPGTLDNAAIIAQLPNGNYAATGMVAGPDVSTVAANDLDLDGKTDLVFGYDSSLTTVGLCWNGHDATGRPNPRGGFAPITYIAGTNQGYHPTQVLVLNPDRDGDLDIVYTNQSNGLVGVALNDGTPDAANWPVSYTFRNQMSSPATVADLKRAYNWAAVWIEYDFNTAEYAAYRLALVTRNAMPVIEPVREWTIGPVGGLSSLRSPDLDRDLDPDLIASSGRYIFATGNPNLNRTPKLAGLRFDRDQAMRGQTILLTAENPSDPDADGYIREVRFYRDNGNGSFDAADQQVGADTQAAGGWTTQVRLDPNSSAGNARFFAMVVDELGEAGEIRENSISVRINQRPIIGSVNSSNARRQWGTRVTLRARGIVEPNEDLGDRVTRVDFSIDLNRNGRYDTSDPVVAAASPDGAGGWVANFGIRKWMGAGQTLFFARAVDQQGAWSDAPAVSINIRRK